MTIRLVVCAAALLAAVGCETATQRRQIREAIFREMQPVAITNCQLRRFGSANDGGYVMCANLIAGAQSAYSYGIDREDNWGCQLSREFSLPVHQYDCFTPHRPACDGGNTMFHAECVGSEAYVLGGRPYDTVVNQIAKNGDSGKPLIVKMDVEGAEWDSLMATPDEVLARIQQMPMELHGVDEERFLRVIEKLKRTFHLVNVHYNNWACSSEAGPMPAIAYQVLWVNKQLAEVDPTRPPQRPDQPPNAPDNPRGAECPSPAR